MLNFLTPETIKLLGSTKDEITKDENCENVPNLEITEVVIVPCNIVNNYQQNSKFLYTLFPNKLFGQLLDILSKNFVFLKTFNSEIPFIEVRFTDQISKSLEIEHKINITLVKKNKHKFYDMTNFLLKFILAFELHSSLSRMFTTNFIL